MPSGTTGARKPTVKERPPIGALKGTSGAQSTSPYGAKHVSTLSRPSHAASSASRSHLGHSPYWCPLSPTARPRLHGHRYTIDPSHRGASAFGASFAVKATWVP